jgi:uncharacterized phiE125 gp8 family phage protein
MNSPDTIRVLQWPLVEPVSLSEAKTQVGIMEDQVEFDRFLLDKIGTARRLVEQRLSMTLVATQYRATWAAGSESIRVLHLPKPPVLVTEAFPLTVTVDGVALTGSDYTLDADAFPAALTLNTATRTKVVVTFWGGLAPGQPIDPMLRSAILAYVTHQFENRGVLNTEGGGELPQAFETLLAAASWNGGW